MRKIEIEGPISIMADEPDAKYGNVSHRYLMTFGHEFDDMIIQDSADLVFQRGPVKEVGVNGITEAVLVAVLIDRFQGFQSGPFKCPENESALLALYDVRQAIDLRTAARVKRGVEGTNVK